MKRCTGNSIAIIFGPLKLKMHYRLSNFQNTELHLESRCAYTTILMRNSNPVYGLIFQSNSFHLAWQFPKTDEYQ